MRNTAIGEIAQINRYPVKSFAGESLNQVSLESYGVFGDRSHAFVDDTKEGWFRYVTARQIPQMLSYKAELDMQRSDLEYPQVKIACPDGRILGWSDLLLEEIQSLSAQKLSMESYCLRSREQMAVDDGSILIVTNGSLKKLEQLWGNPIDPRRFRANFLVSLYDDVIYNDSDFIGKRLVIGNAELAVTSLCERCSIITLDPDTLERDPALLSKVHESFNLTFGIYADVVSVGTVAVGDLVYAVE